MDKTKIKKLLILNIPYIILGLFATNLGEAWRLAEGADMTAKLLGFFSTFTVALRNPLPSFHPMDLMVGIICGVALRLAVYLKGKNAKKYRHNEEYGSARWGTAKDIEPFMAPKFEDNIILTKTERLMMGNLSGLFDSVNNQVGEIASDVGMTPANFSPGVFAMIRNISENVIIPIAGLILTFIVCHELIQLIIDHNNLANFETWIFFKWVFKTFVAVMLITNTFNITMAVFDVSQHVVNASAGIISGSTAVDASALETMEETLNAMELGPLLGLFLQSFIVQVTMSILSVVIFVIVYGRMVEIYLMTSLAPISFSTFGNREQSQIGQNYLRSLFALGFQGFLIIICVGIYAVLVQSVAFSDDIIASIWGVMGYTVLLCFTLFKTGSLAKSVFSAH